MLFLLASRGVFLCCVLLFCLPCCCFTLPAADYSRCLSVRARMFAALYAYAERYDILSLLSLPRSFFSHGEGWIWWWWVVVVFDAVVQRSVEVGREREGRCTICLSQVESSCEATSFLHMYSTALFFSRSQFQIPNSFCDETRKKKKKKNTNITI
jgi:hypothetical protein